MKPRRQHARQPQQRLGRPPVDRQRRQRRQPQRKTPHHPRRQQNDAGAIGQIGLAEQPRRQQYRRRHDPDRQQGQPVIQPFHAQGGNGRRRAHPLLPLRQVQRPHQLPQSERQHIVRQIADADHREQPPRPHRRHRRQQIAPPPGPAPLPREIQAHRRRQIQVVGRAQRLPQLRPVHGDYQQRQQDGADDNARPETPVAEKVGHICGAVPTACGPRSAQHTGCVPRGSRSLRINLPMSYA